MRKAIYKLLVLSLLVLLSTLIVLKVNSITTSNLSDVSVKNLKETQVSTEVTHPEAQFSDVTNKEVQYSELAEPEIQLLKVTKQEFKLSNTEERESGKISKDEEKLNINSIPKIDTTVTANPSKDPVLEVTAEGKSYEIWFAQFTCNINMCEGFDEPSTNRKAETVIIGRRGDVSIKMEAPNAKDGFKFVGWQEKGTTIIENRLIKIYEAMYEKDGESKVEIAELKEPESQLPDNEKLETQDSEATDPEVQVPNLEQPSIEEIQPAESIPNIDTTVTANPSKDPVLEVTAEGKSYEIWFAQFTCDINMCEGFDDPGTNKKSDTVIIGRRGDVSIKMEAPNAKDGFKFVRWEENGTTIIKNRLIKIYKAVYENAVKPEFEIPDVTKPESQVPEIDKTVTANPGKDSVLEVTAKGKYWEIWFAQFTCDINMCEGFDEPGTNKKSDTVIVGRRGDASIKMQAPQAKEGFQFVGWKEKETTLIKNRILKTYEPMYEKIVKFEATQQETQLPKNEEKEVEVPEVTKPDAQVPNVEEPSIEKIETPDSIPEIDKTVTANPSENPVLEVTAEGKSYEIWFAQFTCDINMCEGFDEHLTNKKVDTVIEGRRGDVSIIMTAPQAKDGFQFVGWKERGTTTIKNRLIKIYEAMYEKIVETKVDEPQIQVPEIIETNSTESEVVADSEEQISEIKKSEVLEKTEPESQLSEVIEPETQLLENEKKEVVVSETIESEEQVSNVEEPPIKEITETLE